jgi:hypothetical protein
MSRRRSETLEDFLAVEFKQVHNAILESGIERIILVDAIGNYIPITTGFCLTYDARTSPPHLPPDPPPLRILLTRPLTRLAAYIGLLSACSLFSLTRALTRTR